MAVIIVKEIQMCSEPRVQKKFAFFESVRIILVNAAFSLWGFFVARGVIFGIYSPFGAAYIASVPNRQMLWSLVGTTLGYLLPSEVNTGARYIATTIAICAIRWTLSDLKRLRKHVLFAPLVAFLPMFITGIALNFTNGIFSSSMAINLTESLFAGVGAYFFCEAMHFINEKRYLEQISYQDLASVVMSICIVILSLSSVTFWNLSLGRIIAIAIILFCSEYMGLVGGSVAGIASGVTFSLTGLSLSYISGAYSFGGMMAGLTSRFGRPILIAAFMISNVVISMQTGNIVTVISGVYEALLASAVYLFLPDILGQKFKGIFYIPKENKSENRLKKSVLSRLRFVSGALLNISDSVNIVSQKLSKLSKDNIETVCSGAVDEVCSNCSFRTMCFNTMGEETGKAFADVTEILKRNAKITYEDFSEDFTKRCKNMDRLINSINDKYHDFVLREAASSRISEVKSFAGAQFGDMGKILSDISKEFESYEVFDVKTAQNVATEVKKQGITPLDVSCKIDRYNRMFVEVDVLGNKEDGLDKEKLTKRVSNACCRQMEMPNIVSIGERSRLVFNQKPKYSVQIGASQHVCHNGTFCGDSYTYFNDGVGRVVIILCDGMGTGGRAAVEGAMACEILSTLIKSGVSLDMALKITNSALIIKSEDEFLATADIISIDLFTGKVEFMKAGAPFSLVKKRGKVKEIDLASLPVGILSDISISKTEDKLVSGDSLLVFSDGAQISDDNFLQSELKSWTKKSAKEFSESVMNKLVDIRKTEGDDDITVLAIRLQEK